MATMSTSGDYCILTVTSEDKVPSRLKLLHEGVLFLLMMLLSSFRMGYFSTTSATRKSKSKAKLD